MADTATIKNTVEPILNTVSSTVVTEILDPSPLTEIALGVTVLVLVISMHGWCLGHISRRFAVAMGRLQPQSRRWRVNLLMGLTVAALALTHLAETLVWAAPIWYLGLVPDFHASYFFTLESYTTLGASDVDLPQGWQLIGPVIAITGLFTFSWTGSVLVYVMSEIGHWHARATDRKAGVLGRVAGSSDKAEQQAARPPS
jgi:hypothetical protein